MNTKGSMSSDSWIALECLIVLAGIGAASFFWTPKYPEAVGIVLTAVVGVLQAARGAKAGAKMPEQAGGPQPGQASQTKTTTEVTSQAPPEPTVV